MLRTAKFPATTYFALLLRGTIAPLKAICLFFVRLSEVGPRMEAVRRLNAMTDDDLVAKGLNREGEVHRIFGDRFIT